MAAPVFCPQRGGEDVGATCGRPGCPHDGTPAGVQSTPLHRRGKVRSCSGGLRAAIRTAALPLLSPQSLRLCGGPNCGRPQVAPTVRCLRVHSGRRCIRASAARPYRGTAMAGCRDVETAGVQSTPLQGDGDGGVQGCGDGGRARLAPTGYSWVKRGPRELASQGLLCKISLLMYGSGCLFCPRCPPWPFAAR